MKTMIVMILAMALAGISAADGNITYNWSRIDGDYQSQWNTASAVDQDGCLISAGAFLGNLNFGIGNLSDAGYLAGPDLYLVKFDPDGEALWSKKFTAEDGAYIFDVATDAQGNIAIAGEFETYISIGNQARYSQGTGGDGFVAVFNSAGNHQWTSFQSSAGQATSKSVDFDPDGGVVVIGQFNVDVDLGGTVVTTTSANNIYLAKYSSTGALVSSRGFGSNGNDYAEYVEVLDDGRIRVAVETVGRVTFSPEFIFRPADFYNEGYTDILLLTFLAPSSSTIFLGYQNQVVGGSGPVFFDGMTRDSSGNTYLAVDYEGQIRIGGMTRTSDLCSAMVKLNPDLESLWYRRIDVFTEPYCHGIKSLAFQEGNIVHGVDPGVLITGYFTDLIMPAQNKLYGSGGRDGMLLKYSEGGDYLWGVAYGDEDHQELRAVGVDDRSQIYLSGQAMGSIDFGGGPLNSAGSWDVVHARVTTRIDEPLRIRVVPRFHSAASLFTVPNGTGHAFNQACAYDGGNVDATLDVQILSGNQPVAGYPAEDILMINSEPGFGYCDGGVHPEGNTGEDGWTSFSAALFAGGQTETLGTEFTLAGVPVIPEFQPGDAPEYLVNSPDINGDLFVNLSDLVIFTQDLYAPVASYRSDFRWDGVIDLADIGLFAMGLGAACPGKSGHRQDHDIVGSLALVVDGQPDDGGNFRAHVVARGRLAPDLTAFDLQFELSDNLELVSSKTAGDVLSISQFPRFTVALGEGKFPVVDGDVRLLTLDLRVTDDREANITLVDPYSGEATSLVDVTVDGIDPVCAVQLDDEGETGQAAVINPSEDQEMISAPAEIGCYPNPFNPSTTLQFSIPRSGQVSLKIYAVDGTLVDELISEHREAGNHEAHFGGTDRSGRRLASGVYFARLQAPGVNETTRMMLVK
jgi:hypothetical protein